MSGNPPLFPTFSCDFVAKGCIAITDVFIDFDDLVVFSESSKTVKQLSLCFIVPELEPLELLESSLESELEPEPDELDPEEPF